MPVPFMIEECVNATQFEEKQGIKIKGPDYTKYLDE